MKDYNRKDKASLGKESNVLTSTKYLKEVQVAEGQFDMHACFRESFVKRWIYFHFFHQTVKKHFTNPDLKVLTKRCCISYLELNHKDSKTTQIIAESAKFRPTNPTTRNVNGERTTNKKASNPLKPKAPMH